MKIFTNKSIIHKIITVLIILLLISFVLSSTVQAGSILEAVGGALLGTILDLVTGIADWIISFIQNAIFGIEESFLHIDRGNQFWSTFWGVVGAILVIAVCIVLVFATQGTAAAFIGVAISKLGVGGVLAFAGVTFLGVQHITSEALPDDLLLPIIQISPETIISRRNSYI